MNKNTIELELYQVDFFCISFAAKSQRYVVVRKEKDHENCEEKELQKNRVVSKCIFVHIFLLRLYRMKTHLKQIFLFIQSNYDQNQEYSPGTNYWYATSYRCSLSRRVYFWILARCRWWCRWQGSRWCRTCGSDVHNIILSVVTDIFIYMISVYDISTMTSWHKSFKMTLDDVTWQELHSENTTRVFSGRVENVQTVITSTVSQTIFCWCRHYSNVLYVKSDVWEEIKHPLYDFLMTSSEDSHHNETVVSECYGFISMKHLLARVGW